MTLLNFSHPIAPEQRTAIERLTGQVVEHVIDLKTKFNYTQPFADQARTLADSAGLSPERWQFERLLVNLPSLSVITALLLAELHGRMGYFPAVLYLRPVEGSTPPQFEVAEILNLQAVRDAARQGR